MAVAQHAAERNRCFQQAAKGGVAEYTVTHADFRQAGFRHAVDAAQLLIPLQCVDVEQLSAAGVGVIGLERFFLGQVRHQKAVDGAEAKLVFLRQLCRAGFVLQDPRHLGRGEIGRERDSRFLLYGVGVGGQFFADIFCARALPDDGLANRFAGRAVPCGDRLTLVADADCNNLFRPDIRLCQHIPCNGQRVRQNLVEVVADPALFVDVLPVGAVGTGGQLACHVKQHGLCSLCGLVDG